MIAGAVGASREALVQRTSCIRMMAAGSRLGAIQRTLNVEVEHERRSNGSSLPNVD